MSESKCGITRSESFSGRFLRKLKFRLAYFTYFAWLVGSVASAYPMIPVSSQPNRVWEIGRADESTSEFKADWDFSKEKNPTFVVGLSKPAEDWSAFHPASSDALTSERAHPFVVVFRLAGTPQGTFYLDIDVIFQAKPVPGHVNELSPLRIPDYIVEINGRRGRFYFHPKPSSDVGDFESLLDASASIAHLRIALPAAYFHQGENRFVLSCLDGPTDIEALRKAGSDGPAGIYYDALSLTNAPLTQFNPSEVQAAAFPTIFYHTNRAGQLSESIMVEVRSAGHMAPGRTNLLVGDRQYTCPLTAPYDFGETRCVVDVPEFAPKTAARLTVEGFGEEHSYSVDLTPQKKFKLFLVPQIHLDPGYFDYRPNTYEVNDRSLDYIIQQLESHPDYRYTPDGWWIVKDYLTHRGPRWQQRMVELLKANRIGLPAQPFNMDTGLISQEGLNRSSYFSEELRRKFGISYEAANLCDVPAATWAWPSYLHSIGVKHLVVGSNSWRAPFLINGQLDRKSPFWWEGPDGGKVLTWYARQYLQGGKLFGTPASVTVGVNNLPVFLQNYASNLYSPDAVMIYGTQLDDAPFDPSFFEVADAWNKKFAYPRITMAGINDFFRYMERNYGRSFPTYRGDGGAWWEEMAFADAYYTGIVRQTTGRAVTAETLASLGIIVNQDFEFPLLLDHDIWSNLLLYSEHTWGHVHAWLQPDSDLSRGLLHTKESFGIDAAAQVEDLLHRGFDQLYSKLNARGDLVVLFNPLSWRRSGLVEVEIPRGSSLVDLKTQQPVTMELLRGLEDEDYDRVRFWAENIPALGYRSYAVSAPAIKRASVEVPAAKGRVVENAFYRVTIDSSRDGISSIYDKQLGVELVDQNSPYALDQYVYAAYGHEQLSLVRQRNVFNSSLLARSAALPAAKLHVEKASHLTMVGIKQLPWGTVMLFETSALHTPRISTEIRLFNREKRIELVNTIHKNVVRAPEGVYFAFPFTGKNPSIRYDIQNGWVNPMQDQLPGANKEWFCAQQWIAVSNARVTVALAVNEAPLFTIGDIVRGRWPNSLEVRDGTVFSYVMNNYNGDDERPYQGGDFTFHYVIGSASEFNATALSRLGMETTRPLEVDASPLGFTRNGMPTEPLSPSEESFLQIDIPEVILSAWKGAEDGNGYILRFYNTSERPVTSHLEFPNLQFDGLIRTNPVEADQEVISSEKGRFALALGPHEIYSLRVKGLRLRQGVRSTTLPVAQRSVSQLE